MIIKTTYYFTTWHLYFLQNQGCKQGQFCDFRVNFCGTQKRVKYYFLTNVFFITFNQYQRTFHLSYCASLYHKVDIFIIRNFSIIFDFGFVPSVSKTLISLLFINIFAPIFFWLEISIFFKYPESFNLLGLTVLKSVMGWKKWKILENVFFAFLCNFR